MSSRSECLAQEKGGKQGEGKGKRQLHSRGDDFGWHTTPRVTPFFESINQKTLQRCKEKG